MKAVRLHAKGDLRVEEIAAPAAPLPGCVNLAVTAAGICGSDLHNFRTGQWISRSPSVPGHELIGRVTALGAGVADLAPGDRVVADSRFWCGDCPACRAGNHHLCASLGFVGEVCDGGFAEATSLPRRLLHKLPEDLPDEAAVMAEPVAVALHAVRRLRAEAQAPVLIAGCGPIGGLAALVLWAAGHRDIRVADRNAQRLARVCAVTGARPVDLTAASAGADIRFAIEATGSTAALESLLGCMSGGGAIALVGIMHGRIALDPNILVEREVSLIGCHAFRDELPEAIQLLARVAPQARHLIDREITLADVPQAYERLIAGKSEGLKTIIRP
ncbi:dehydrogenase [Aestuariivirga litoralis]|uniref:Dehydrogenase n=1 Tax=Aestuariivirga litoralis TaxID=2650924 RepID=A0A2W2BJ11_9HYPH|nr:alcohol dehydrogenase catalytic domain-containing protein [Aestuariivirga litoralis]PZF76169.1 dehydrogenase [Aestuariivirga litoralis]